MKICLPIIFLMISASLSAQCSAVVTFVPVMNGRPAELNKSYAYTNKDSLQLEMFRCYIAGLHLDGSPAGGYHLLDLEDSVSMVIRLDNIRPGTYRNLFFQIGTDSLANVSGATGGALDPTNGMYWAWNSGYVNFKIEGTSPVCKTLHHAFTYHVGGYMPPHPTCRNLVLPLKKLKIKQGKKVNIRIEIDLSKFLRQTDLRVNNQMMIPSAQAAQLADLFAKCFQTGQ